MLKIEFLKLFDSFRTVIKAFSTVRVRAEATTESAQVGELMVGSRVEVLDQKFVNGYTWYRVYNGWVHGDYIELDAPFVGHQTTTNTNTNTTTPVTGPRDEVAGMSTTAILKHRTNDYVQFFNNDLSQANETKLVNGETVVITGLRGVGTDVWAKTKHGWFNLTDESVNFLAVGKVNTADDNYLNVYSEAGKNRTQPVDKIRDQASITLTGIAVSNTSDGTSYLWGKTASGWVDMTHVEVTAVKEAYADSQQTAPLSVINVKGLSNEQFNVRPKPQHLSINVYNQINGYAIGIIAKDTLFDVKKIQASGSEVWICIEEDATAKEYWLKFTDVIIEDNGVNNGNVIMACDMTTSAGGTNAAQQLYLNNGVRFTDFAVFNGEIYAYGTANGKTGWVNTKFMHKWANLPTTEIAERTSAIIAADFKAITYTYDAANGNIVGTLHDGDPTNHKIWIKEVVANNGIVWGKTTVQNNQTRWIKMSDVTYSIPAKVVEKTFAKAEAGSEITMGTEFAKGADVTVNNLKAVGSNIYAQITSATNNGGWLKNTQLSVWTALPKVGLSSVTTGSGVMVKCASHQGTLYATASETATSFGQIAANSTVLVKEFKVAEGFIWVRIPYTNVAADYTTTSGDAWMKYGNLQAFTANATMKAAEELKWATGGAVDTVANGAAVTMKGLEIGMDGVLYAKISYTKDNVAYEGYVIYANLNVATFTA